MQKEVYYPGIEGPILVAEDGTSVVYNGKSLHLSLIKAKSSRYGFYQVSVGGKSLYLHKLVAFAFVPNPKPVSYKLLLHKNGISTDNRAENLMWGNRALFSQNMKRLFVADIKRRGSSTISYEEAIKIAKRLDEGEFAKDICKEYNVSEMSIARIRRKYCDTKVKSIRYDKSIIENVQRLCLKHSAPHVAKVTGIPYETVYRWNKMNKKKDLE